MSVVSLHRIPSADPADTSGLAGACKDGLDPSRAFAVVGKTEGNGCVNDFTRGMAAAAWQAAFPAPVVAVMSGGTEGVLSPHVVVLATADDDDGYPCGALVAAAGRTPRIAPEQLGRRGQAEAVAATVRQLCTGAGIEASGVEFVLVKCPLLTSAAIAGQPPGTLRSSETYESMAHSRAASALGAARALGEITDIQLDAGLAGDLDVFSSIASASAGVEVDCCEVVVLGHNPEARGPLRATHTVMRDALDAASVQLALERIRAAGGHLVHLFAKAEADPSGSVRGRRHTMLTDSDIHDTRHARAALGGLLAGLTGESAIYVSGGAEHQGPPGGGPVTIIWEIPKVSVPRHA
jgi:cyanuric acid amidohydrolase